MSYNGSGTFVINSTGQPVVTGTVISSSTFNSLTADLGTGLSTAITKDGQTTTTAKIPFALGISAAVASNFAAGTVAAPSIYLSTDTGTGFYRIGANNTGFAISGTKLLDFSSALFAVTGAATVSTTLGVSGVITGTSSGSALTLSNGTAGTRLSAYVNHTDNTNTGSHASLFAEVGGTSGGDPCSLYSIPGGTSWSAGVDNSDSDIFKIGYSVVVGTNTALSITTAGAVTIPGTLGVTDNTGMGQAAAVGGRLAITFSGPNARGYYGIDLTGQLATSEVHLRFSNPNGAVGSVTTSGSATAYNTSSDYRLKHDVAPMVGALERVNRLNPVTYKWNVDKSDGEGFLAHELQEVIPQCVTGEKDKMEMEEYEISPAVPATYDKENKELTPAIDAVMGEREVPAYQGVDTSFLIATLTAAIQELSAKVATLEAR
mgnify:CR=1 FL=1|tara:strand:- start:7778 stop:9073 length:1296 start_codon:yes stop_codon:yes gene_type:complete